MHACVGLNFNFRVTVVVILQLLGVDEHEDFFVAQLFIRSGIVVNREQF